MDAEEEPEPDAVGVTIVTGFLGAGKSTLIRRVLKENHGLRVVVVENEFGSTSGVEAAIVTQGLGPSAFDNFIELPNGCICCSAQSDLTSALSRLVRESASGKKIDHILVEASGLADPGPVAAQFWLDAELETALRLDAVVAVVDAVHFPRQIEGTTRKLAEKQVAVADALILNKRDAVEPEQYSAVKAEVMKLNATARVLPATKCDVDLRSVLNVNAYEAATAWRDAERLQKHVSHVPTGASSVVLKFPGVYFDERLLDRALGALLWEEANGSQTPSGNASETAMEVWRMKALVFVHDEEFLYVYQGVHTLFEGEETDVRAKDKATVESCFIFIGRSLREQSLRKGLESAAVNN